MQGKEGPRHRPTGRFAPVGSRPERGAVCEVCGNGEGRCFEVHLGGEKHVFDSFECATRCLLPRCARCECQILNPGVQIGEWLYCSYSCASLSSGAEVYLFTTD